jgi:hypothetical protein
VAENWGEKDVVLGLLRREIDEKENEKRKKGNLKRGKRD